MSFETEYECTQQHGMLTRDDADDATMDFARATSHHYEADNDDNRDHNLPVQHMDDAYLQRLHVAEERSKHLRDEVQYIEQELEEKHQAVSVLTEQNMRLQV